MTARLGCARCIALLPGLVAGLLTTEIAAAACVSIASHPDGAPLATYGLPAGEPVFAVTYVHSVTMTPVEERYRIDGSTLVETMIRFEQHGPGLPTAPDAGEQWTRRDGRFEVTLNRRFERIVMRVHGAQKPMLDIGPRNVDLARWGDRAVALSGSARPCAAP